MPGFRYAQHCPLARAAEVVGQRWMLLVVRELLLGPKRFSDLRQRMPGVSSSVLADRLEQLEALGIAVQRALPPPTPAVLYELTASGRALLPVVISLARWGARFLGPPQPGDHFEPDWLRLGLVMIARRDPTPAVRCAVEIGGAEPPVVFGVAGGPDGTRLLPEAGTADVRIRASSPLSLMAIASGLLAPGDALASGEIEVEGDRAALDAFPALFDASGAAEPEPELLGAP